MSALQVIDEIKHLPPSERAQVARFVMENDDMAAGGKFAVAVADDGLPIIRANGVITSRLVSELESMTP